MKRAPKISKTENHMKTMLVCAAALGAALSLSGCQTATEQTGTSTFAGSFKGEAKEVKTKKSNKPYEELIKKHAKANGVPYNLALAVVGIESSFNASARGRAGEVGLMQIKPATARGMGYSGSTKSLYNPDTNLRWGMKYLGEARKRAGGDLCGTILRYNAGHYAKRMNKVSANYCRKVKQRI
jgi:soluble lytic murein transglycosylase-like protein